MRGFLKWLNLSSVFSLPTRLLMALVLVFVSNSAFSMSCGGYASPSAYCGSTPNDKTVIDRGGTNTMHEYGCTTSAGTLHYTVTCTGGCAAGEVMPSASNGWKCSAPDTPNDDCSTNIGTGSKDLSGNTKDGSCTCPAGKETLNAGTSTASCADPCAAGTHRDTVTGACIANCTDGFAWDSAASVCTCDGYPGMVNDVMTCVKATSSQLGAIQASSAATAAAVTAQGLKQDATNAKLDTQTQQNTTIINGQAQQLSAMGATAASSASTATSAAAGAVSSATTASNTATISAATQATNTKLDTTNAGLADLAAGIGTANQSLTAIKGSLSGTVTQGEQGTFTAPTSEEENVLRTALNAKYTEISGGLTQIFTPPVLEGNSGLPCYRNIPLFDDYDFDICLSDYEDEMSIIPAFIYGFGIFLAAFIVIGGAKND